MDLFKSMQSREIGYENMSNDVRMALTRMLKDVEEAKSSESFVKPPWYKLISEDSGIDKMFLQPLSLWLQRMTEDQAKHCVAELIPMMRADKVNTIKLSVLKDQVDNLPAAAHEPMHAIVAILEGLSVLSTNTTTDDSDKAVRRMKDNLAVIVITNPAILAAGLSADDMKPFVAKAHGALEMAASKRATGAVNKGQQCLESLQCMLAEIPGVQNDEAGFMSYVRKNSAQMTKLQKQCEKSLHELKKTGQAEPKLGEAVRDVINVITIYTLITLLRVPQIRNREEKAMRQNLKQVHGQFVLDKTLAVTSPFVFSASWHGMAWRGIAWHGIAWHSMA